MPPTSISIVIPVHNQARYIYRAVASCYWQLGPLDEILIVDDASTDLEGGRGGVEPFLDRSTWLINERNRGVSFSRNRAIQNSQKEWIKFLDADDVLAPFALNCLHQAPELPDHIQVVTGGCHRVINHRHCDFLTGAEEALQWIRYTNPILPSATFVRRRALLEVGLFDERIDFEEDWDLWLKLHERFGRDAFAVTDQPICFYWIEAQDREIAQGKRQGLVDGLPVREYFRKRYGADPK
ncbi:MAG: glycosyltransferase family A protein [Verrucomicrobiota bacterium]